VEQALPYPATKLNYAACANVALQLKTSENPYLPPKTWYFAANRYIFPDLLANLCEFLQITVCPTGKAVM